jgi:uncharacterized Zn finger protein
MSDSIDRRPLTIGGRWRREANRGVDDKRLEMALATLPSIRKPNLRVRAGGILAEMEGAMGSINEVVIHVPTLASRCWPQIARILRRSLSMLQALEKGQVPRSFDRLVARVSNESLFPDARKVASACTCGAIEAPCRHVLALHELVARRLDERPWELLTLRGGDLRALLEKARATTPDEDAPPLSYGATEEPVLFPEGEAGDLDYALAPGQVNRLLGVVSSAVIDAVVAAIDRVGTVTHPLDAGTPP